MSDYIKNNLKSYNGAKGLFEVTRGLKEDRQLTFKFIALYNDLLDKLPDFNDKKKEFDLSVICDLLLDLFREQANRILSASEVVNDFKQQQKQSLPYELNGLVSRVPNAYNKEILKVIVSLIQECQ